MGAIKIVTMGSFRHEERVFSAMKHGHVDAVGQAIEWLSKEILPEANVNDHECHDDEVRPSEGWGR